LADVDATGLTRKEINNPAMFLLKLRNGAGKKTEDWVNKKLAEGQKEVAVGHE